MNSREIELCECIKYVAGEISAVCGVLTPMYLTGSLALYYYGLRSIESIHDIDIVIVGNVSEDALNKLRDKFELREYASSGLEAEVHGFHNDIPVDIFHEQDRSGSLMDLIHPTMDFIALNPLPKILEAKRRMNRPKDYESLSEMSKIIFNENDQKAWDSQGMPF